MTPAASPGYRPTWLTVSGRRFSREGREQRGEGEGVGEGGAPWDVFRHEMTAWNKHSPAVGRLHSLQDLRGRNTSRTKYPSIYQLYRCTYHYTPVKSLDKHTLIDSRLPLEGSKL